MNVFTTCLFSDNDGDLYYLLCSVFPESPIGEVLSSFDCHHSSIEFIQRYVKDFVKMVHKCKHSDRKYVEKEYKVSKEINRNMLFININLLICKNFFSLAAVYHLNEPCREQKLSETKWPYFTIR